MGKKKAPPPPDYASIALAQGKENKDTAMFNSNINRVNQVGPNGSSTWSLRAGVDPRYVQPGDYTQTTTLSEAGQNLQNSQDRISQNLAGVAEAGLDRVGNVMANPFDTSGLNSMQTNLQTTGANLRTGVDGGPLDNTLDRTGLPELPGSGGYGAQAKAVQDAMFARMQPQLQRDRGMEENKLLNSGIERGTQAWDDAQRVMGTKENDASMSAILAGSGEQSRLAGIDMSARSQLFGEEGALSSFFNSAQGQEFQQGLANVGVNNSAEGTRFNQGLAADTFNNEARGQSLQEQQYLRQQPLNELNALRTGSQVATPTFGGYYTGASANPSDIYGAAKDGYGAAVDTTNAANAQKANTISAIGSVAGAAMMF